MISSLSLSTVSIYCLPSLSPFTVSLYCALHCIPSLYFYCLPLQYLSLSLFTVSLYCLPSICPFTVSLHCIFHCIPLLYLSLSPLTGSLTVFLHWLPSLSPFTVSLHRRPPLSPFTVSFHGLLSLSLFTSFFYLHCLHALSLYSTFSLPSLSLVHYLFQLISIKFTYVFQIAEKLDNLPARPDKPWINNKDHSRRSSAAHQITGQFFSCPFSSSLVLQLSCLGQKYRNLTQTHYTPVINIHSFVYNYAVCIYNKNKSESYNS